MIIQIKQLILENIGFSGPMHATTKYNKLVPNNSENKGIDPKNNGSLINAKTEATKRKEPGNLSTNIIRDKNREILKASLKAQNNQ